MDPGRQGGYSRSRNVARIKRSHVDPQSNVNVAVLLP